MAKTRVESTLILSAYELNRLGVFSELLGVERTLSWKTGSGEVTASMQICVDSDLGSINLRYGILRRFDDDSGPPINYTIALERMPCHYGGYRYYFTCPLSVDGTGCYRKVAKLYLPPGAKYFGCRHCYDLSYESRQTFRGTFYWAILKPLELLNQENPKWDKMTSWQRAKYAVMLQKIAHHSREFAGRQSTKAIGR